MKSFFNPSALLLSLVLFASCKKEKSVEIQGSTPGISQWEFKESAVLYKGNMDTAYYESVGNISSLVLAGSSSTGSDEFQLQLFGVDITTGEYKNPNVIFQYSINGLTFYENVPLDADKFSVEITSLDSSSVTGTFRGEIQDAVGNTKQITDGKFSAKIKLNSPPPAPGQLLLWSKQGCGGNGSILVKVQNQTGNITSFSTTTPDCGASGSVTIDLSQGSYTWKAFCGTDSSEGTVSIVSGNCTKAEVILGLPPVTSCKVSNIGFYDPTTNVADGSLTSSYNASNQVTKIQFIDSTSGSVAQEYNLTYAPSRINIDGSQFFVLDGSGRIKEFHGALDLDTSGTPVIITYTYDGAGYLIKSSVALALAPTVPLLLVNQTWSGNNLVKVIIQDLSTNEKTEIEYQYDLAKPAKSSLVFFPNSEIITFQSAVNFGKNSTNIATKSTIKNFNATGGVTSTNVSDFINYTFDGNNNVRSFEITGDESVYGTDVKFVLSHRCF